MGIRGAKPSIEKFSVENPTFTPTGVANSISPPNDLTDLGKEKWKLLLEDLTSNGVYRPVDALLLTEICDLFARLEILRRQMKNPVDGWWKYERDLSREEREDFLLNYTTEAEREEMWLISTTYKRLRTDYTQSVKLLLSMTAEFGITPVARLRLGLLQLQGSSLTAIMAGDGDDDAPPELGGVGPYGDAVDGEVVESGF